jgi:hypothetical protein
VSPKFRCVCVCIYVYKTDYNASNPIRQVVRDHRYENPITAHISSIVGWSGRQATLIRRCPQSRIIYCCTYDKVLSFLCCSSHFLVLPIVLSREKYEKMCAARRCMSVQSVKYSAVLSAARITVTNIACHVLHVLVSSRS